MNQLALLKDNISCTPQNSKYIYPVLMYSGFVQHFDDPVPIARAYAIESLFTGHGKHIYTNDLIAGSIHGLLSDDESITDERIKIAEDILKSYGSRYFSTNSDHFAADYETILADGIGGTLQKIADSMLKHKKDSDSDKKLIFLKAAEISMRAFGTMVEQYGIEAENMASSSETNDQKANMLEISRICKKIATHKPDTFREALQLVWLVHTAFCYEGRYAMAFGRMDQYLYTFYKKDIDAGILKRETALALLECTLIKISERRYLKIDDIVNIAIAGRKPNGDGGLNELSYLILEAVKNCNIPGPNLSARIYDGISDEFLDECIQVIGTGLGYPALMNDEVNIPALHHYGYSIEDSRNYCMVGCIENFIQGKQPPWSDGRFNTPKYMELALNNGRSMQTGQVLGPQTGETSEIQTMEEFLQAFRNQMVFGASEYMVRFLNENDRFNKVAYTQPFLSCFCRCCIERGLDINDGGALYPSVHGACAMGIATVADSLAAIEEIVFKKKSVSLTTLRNALIADYEGYANLQSEMLRAPKYGNNDPACDKYACWFVDVQAELFSKYHTRDGGPIYIAIASNVSNIPAGEEIAATPDGRKNRQPLSDAASPAHGRDTRGPTSVINSLSKPDYTKVACGTVVNQKYSPVMFSDPDKRAKLLSLIKVYIKKGGQEIQINSVSREILFDAMEHPENYRNLVVRVSGFSAYYTELDSSIQKDILERTEYD